MEQNNERIKIGPLAYSVEYVRNLRGDDDQKLYGQADHVFHIIKLSTEFTKESDFTTRWHEVVHCIEALYELDMSEHEVNLMSCAIAQVLQDNPGMNWTEVKDGQFSEETQPTET